MSDFQLDHWEELIDTVEKTNVPISFVNRVDINYLDQTQPSKSINVCEFRKQGYTDEQIEEILAEIIKDSSGSSIFSMDFFVDVESVAKVVQKETEKLLHTIK